MDVRYGVLSNVFGKPARRDDYTFMLAHVELEEAHSASITDCPINLAICYRRTSAFRSVSG
ncbi:hypothetical protein EP7_004521 [Isosphaeraceae bacterium EP7]